jgi:hypothetical protein
MKFLLTAFTLVLTCSFLSAQSIDFKLSKNQGEDPLVWNYGNIENASTGLRIFKFTNTGEAPLVITNAKGSCGCTVPSYPKEPIMPGESNEIRVKYDTKRTGAFTKYVTLTTNAKENTTVRLKIYGKVAAPKQKK